MKVDHPIVRVAQGFSLLAVCLLLYSNTYEHPFHLDSTHGLRNNPAIKSLGNIPRFFSDPLTLTSIRQNADYRPVLQVTYALNYAWSAEQTWSWHFVQIVLHAWCGFALMLLTRFLLPRMAPDASRAVRQIAPFAVAVAFVVHPTASGVINYLWARSSLLTAAFLLPAILLYLRGRLPWAAAFYTLALFTKIEAVAALGVFMLWDVLGVAEARLRERPNARHSFVLDTLRALNVETLKRLSPFVIITLGYALWRHQIMPEFAAETRSTEGVTWWHYLLSQTTAWWHYVLRWFAPVHLIADNLAFPVRRTLLDPTVTLALAGWAGVAWGLTLLYQSRPIYTFLAVSALALISPTSSVVPLAAMVNEHRPYLPLAVLSLCWLVPAVGLVAAQWRQTPGARVAVVGALVLLLVSTCLLTRQRNRVFLTWESYWTDVVAKAPSWRSNLNLGYWYMHQGKLDAAETHFKRAIEMQPYNVATLTNLGLLSRRRNRNDEALAYLNRAVAVDRYESMGLENRADLLLLLKRYQDALNDLLTAEKRWRDRFVMHRSFAQAYAGLKQWQNALKQTLTCRQLDADRTAKEIVTIIRPFWDTKAHMAAGAQYFAALVKRWPGQGWAHENLARLAGLLGDLERSKRHHALAKSLEAQKSAGGAALPQ